MFYKIAYAIVRFAFFFVFRIKITGKKNIPEGSPLVVCANHISLADPVFVAFSLGINRTPHTIGKSELFKSKIAKLLFQKGLNGIPINRGKADLGAIKAALSVLKSGGILVIFPEGRRVLNGDDSEARTGAAMLSIKSKADILPIAIKDRPAFMRKIRIVIGEPFTPQVDGRPDHDTYHAVADEIMARIDGLKKAGE